MCTHWVARELPAPVSRPARKGVARSGISSATDGGTGVGGPCATAVDRPKGDATAAGGAKGWTHESREPDGRGVADPKGDCDGCDGTQFPSKGHEFMAKGVWRAKGGADGRV